MRRKAFACFFLVVLSFIPVAAWAQAGAGEASIEGTVVDQTGALVPGATVTARNIATQLTRTVTSNDVGHYVFNNLPPGDYEVTFEKAGFAKLTQRGIGVMTGQRVTVGARLQVSATQETV